VGKTEIRIVIKDKEGTLQHVGASPYQVTLRCSVLQCVAVVRGVLQGVAVSCSVL